MSRILPVLLFCLVCAVPAAGQPVDRPGSALQEASPAKFSRFYAGLTTAMETGGRNQVGIDVIPAAGGFIGFRLSDRWSVDFEADRGWGTSPERVFEGLLIRQVFPEGAHEDSGIYGRSVHWERTGSGYAAHVVWRAGGRGKVTAALMAGIAWRRFEARRVVTITRIGPGVTYPPDHPNRQDVDERRDVTGGGYGGGFMILIPASSRLTVAPVVRFTVGAIDHDWGYKVLTTGIRLLWEP